MDDTPQRRSSDREPPEAQTLRALIADDQKSYRDFLSGLIERFGFEVTACADGAEALSALVSERFDLLIVDCEMPRIDGLQLISAVRGSDRFADVFAIMLTARDDVETKLTALGSGFDDFLGKSAGELEIAAKITAARRLITRQARLDQAVRELYGLATRDELTGLYNRRFFFAETERLLTAGRVVNLAFFDLDEFKTINDTLGHLAGDRILRDLGEVFQRATREQDLIARYGGDEFVMVVVDANPAATEQIARRVASEIAAAEWRFCDQTFRVGVTVGIACSSLLESPTMAQLLSAGDRDLYKNKWVRKHPNDDASRYEYDVRRDAQVVELAQFALTARSARGPE